MPQEVTQRAGEGETGGSVDLHLLDVFDLVFDRILNGEDIDVLSAQLQQHGVQGGRLAAAGGAGGQKQAMAAAEGVIDPLPVELAQANLIQGFQALRGVQQAQHHALAVNGRHHGNAQIDGLAIVGT